MISLLVISSSAWAATTLVSRNPLPLGAPEGAQYTLPQNLPARTGGPYKNAEDIEKILLLAAQSKGESKPIIKNVVLTTHGDLITHEIFSPSYSVADNREVYIGVLEGNFQFNRVRPDMDPIRSQQLNVEVDATTGEVLALGTSELTRDSRIIDSLKLVNN